MTEPDYEVSAEVADLCLNGFMLVKFALVICLKRKISSQSHLSFV